MTVEVQLNLLPSIRSHSIFLLRIILLGETVLIQHRIGSGLAIVTTIVYVTQVVLVGGNPSPIHVELGGELGYSSIPFYMRTHSAGAIPFKASAFLFIISMVAVLLENTTLNISNRMVMECTIVVNGSFEWGVSWRMLGFESRETRIHCCCSSIGNNATRVEVFAQTQWYQQLNDRFLDFILPRKRTIHQRIALLLAMLVRVNVQRQNQNEDHTKAHTKDGDHHYLSFLLNHTHAWTRTPRSHIPTHISLHSAFHRIPRERDSLVMNHEH